MFPTNFITPVKWLITSPSARPTHLLPSKSQSGPSISVAGKFLEVHTPWQSLDTWIGGHSWRNGRRNWRRRYALGAISHPRRQRTWRGWFARKIWRIMRKHKYWRISHAWSSWMINLKHSRRSTTRRRSSPFYESRGERWARRVTNWRCKSICRIRVKLWLGRLWLDDGCDTGVVLPASKDREQEVPLNLKKADVCCLVVGIVV